MTGAERLDAIRQHLLAVRRILLQEREAGFARGVEGVLAELSDEGSSPSGNVRWVAEGWKSLFAAARGLSDFGIWREAEEERVRLNAEYRRHIEALHRLLG